MRLKYIQLSQSDSMVQIEKFKVHEFDSVHALKGSEMSYSIFLSMNLFTKAAFRQVVLAHFPTFAANADDTNPFRLAPSLSLLRSIVPLIKKKNFFSPAAHCFVLLLGQHTLDF